jgi:hypothetical protein
MRVVYLILLLVSLLLTACGAHQPELGVISKECTGGDCSVQQPELVITSQGCLSDLVRLSPNHEPFFIVASETNIPIVVTVPVMNRWLVVYPGTEEQFDLPRYIMGSFDFFCLEEAEHTRLGAGNPYVCALEPDEVSPIALSQGVLEIEPHDRIHEIIGR